MAVVEALVIGDMGLRRVDVHGLAANLIEGAARPYQVVKSVASPDLVARQNALFENGIGRG